jgi:hypothetical protein
MRLPIMQKCLQCFPSNSKICSSMVIGIRRRNKWINDIIFGLICCGMMFVEIHGTFGHSHSLPSYARNRIAYRTSSSPQFNSLEGDTSYPSCSLCYFYRLLGHSITSQADWHFNSQSVGQTVFFYRLFIGRTVRHQQGIRSPPQV